MKKLIITLAITIFLTPAPLQAQDEQPECFPEKVLSSSRVTGTLVDYNIEEVMEIPSNIILNVKGEEMWIIAEPELIEKKFNNKKGKKFHITYERVYGWIGDGCDKYTRLVRVEQVK